MHLSRLVVVCFLWLAVSLAAQGLSHNSALAGQPLKVELCHFPPDNPANFQTITIGANALATHLQHGDFPGPCANDCRVFDSACDDHNPCTVDTCNPDGTCAPPQPINCDDGNLCTSDACDPSTGNCVNTPTIGASCDDTNMCTTGDACTANGQCVGTSIPGCCRTDADCTDHDACTIITCNLATSTCSVPTVKNCDDNDACTADSCLAADGSCAHVPVVPSPLPAGSYQASCIDCRLCGTTLECLCADSRTSADDCRDDPDDNGCHRTSLNISGCTGDIGNQNGSLTCS